MTTFVAPGNVAGPDAPPAPQASPADGKPSPAEQWTQGGQPPAAATPPSEPARPAWLPEKFKSPEDLAKAYQELEGKLGQPQPETAPAAPQGTSDAELSTSLESAGLNLDDFTTEYEANGALSPASYDKLAKAGFSKPFVDQVIEGRVALAEKFTGEIYRLVGGEEQFDAIQSWAKSTIDRATLEAYNAALDRGDFATVKLMTQGIQAAYVEANGQSPKLIGGQPGRQARGFQSTYEMTQAMRDPRYGKDPAYERWVDQMIAHAAF